jgi:hypothetical protein
MHNATTSEAIRPRTGIQKYLLVSTFIAIFSETAMIHSGIDLKLFYLIIIINLPTLLLYWNFKLPRAYLLLLAYAWTSGVVAVLLGSNIVSNFLMEAVGITVSSLYFYLFFQQEEKTVTELIDIYASISYWICIVGLLLCPIESVLLGKFSPVQSILREPAHFCTIILPAFHYYAGTGGLKKGHRARTLIPLLAILLSVSAIGFLGLLLSFSLLLKRRRLGFLFIPVVIAALLAVAYGTLEHFRLRIDDSVRGLTTMDVSSLNISSYATISSLYVTENASRDKPLFGYGLGGYPEAHRRYIGSLSGEEEFEEMGLLSSRDGNSLMLRIVTELGLVGVILLIIFLVRYRAEPDTVYAIISSGIILYFSMKLLREGHWFSPEMYFFVWAYVLVSRRNCGSPSRQKSRTLTLIGREKPSHLLSPDIRSV